METKTTVKELYRAKYSGEELARLMEIMDRDALPAFEEICAGVQKEFDFPEGATEEQKKFHELFRLPPMTEERAADAVHFLVIKAIRREYFARLTREECVALANILYKHGGALTICPACPDETTYKYAEDLVRDWEEEHRSETPIKAPDEDFYM